MLRDCATPAFLYGFYVVAPRQQLQETLRDFENIIKKDENGHFERIRPTTKLSRGGETARPQEQTTDKMERQREEGREKGE